MLECIGCGNCVVVCPVSARRDNFVAGGSGPRTSEVTLAVENGFARWKRLKLCEGCRTCFEACPTGAIRDKIAFRTKMRAAWNRARKKYLD
ncbi:MAG: 4Fe-4S binding protein [Methanocellales archaeon]